MKDIINLPSDLGDAVRQARRDGGLRAVDIAQQSGRSRDVLHRLESGKDVTVASLLDILRAMGLGIRLEKARLPTLEEMQRRYAAMDDSDDDNGGGDAPALLAPTEF